MARKRKTKFDFIYYEIQLFINTYMYVTQKATSISLYFSVENDYVLSV